VDQQRNNFERQCKEWKTKKLRTEGGEKRKCKIEAPFI
jgi:hypothetical protein